MHHKYAGVLHVEEIIAHLRALTEGKGGRGRRK
jgi:hypothetical protein